MVINKGNYIAQCKKGTDSMNEEKIKRMLDACYQAKRIREMLPALPSGVTSDISDTLKLPRPGVTRTVKEMEKKGYLTKYASEEDGRITYVFITEKGEELSDKYDKNYYSRLLKYMDHISEEEADCMISTIEKFYKVMSERRVDIE